MIDNKINLAIIGCGSIVIKRHAPECVENSDINISGFYDLSKERAISLANKFGGIAYDSYDDVLNDMSVDGVIICTANKFHAEMSIAALNKSKHVLCEKPIATSIEDAKKMIAAAEESEKYLMIAHNQRLCAAHQKAKELLKSNLLGKVLSFKTVFAHKGPDEWSIDKGNRTWFLNKNIAVLGALGDLGIHKADLIRWLIDDDIAFVTALINTLDKKDSEGNYIQVEDNALCILESKSGIVGTLEASWICYGDCENTVTLYCQNGVMKIDYESEYQIGITMKNGDRQLIKVNEIDSGVTKTFANCIKTKVSPEIGGKVGLKALNIVLKCIESSQKHTRVNV